LNILIISVGFKVSKLHINTWNKMPYFSIKYLLYIRTNPTWAVEHFTYECRGSLWLNCYHWI